jgi:hypothetical protein
VTPLLQLGLTSSQGLLAKLSVVDQAHQCGLVELVEDHGKGRTCEADQNVMLHDLGVAPDAGDRNEDHAGVVKRDGEQLFQYSLVVPPFHERQKLD